MPPYKLPDCRQMPARKAEYILMRSAMRALINHRIVFYDTESSYPLVVMYKSRDIREEQIIVRLPSRLSTRRVVYTITRNKFGEYIVRYRPDCIFNDIVLPRYKNAILLPATRMEVASRLDDGGHFEFIRMNIDQHYPLRSQIVNTRTSRVFGDYTFAPIPSFVTPATTVSTSTTSTGTTLTQQAMENAIRTMDQQMSEREEALRRYEERRQSAMLWATSELPQSDDEPDDLIDVEGFPI